MRIFYIFFFIQINVFGQNAVTVYNKVSQSTVTIETNDGALGSGFFVSNNIIATNYHVIEGATSANCFLIGSNFPYKIDGFLAVDKNVDLVLLKVSSLNKPAIKLSTVKDVIGQNIFVIGSPKGLPGTISDGIISGYRDFDGTKLIQMTAPISPGSSGGPVLNSNGELVGISVSQLKNGQNLNFAIPRSYLEILMTYKKEYPEDLSKLDNKLKIGQEYAGGIIFFLDNTGKHGKVVTKFDLTNNGKDYMNWQNAMYQCTNLVENGYTDWYLPSKSDLEYVAINRNEINDFRNCISAYWTSSDNGEKAWSFTFYKSYVHYFSPKTSCYYVRAIRNF